jgi:hypothetical protein
MEPTVALGDDLATLRITLMQYFSVPCIAPGDQPPHLSDRGLVFDRTPQ